MLKLCGFAGSNYYNKVKIQLMEKNIPFEEELVWTDRSENLLENSPLGKIPFILTDKGAICESSVIAEYIESAYPNQPLLPQEIYAAAKVRELITFLDIHLELTVRELYPESFFGGSITEETKLRVKKILSRYIKGFLKLAQFSPFVAGDTFTLADCSAAVHLPLISMATKRIYGEDMLADTPVAEYCKMMNQRPVMQKVNADRKENTALLAEKFKSFA